MTGADFLRILYSQYNELIAGQLSSQRMNDIFFLASADFFEPFINQFGLNGAIADEIRPLQATFSKATPMSNILLIDTDFTNYKRLTSLDTTFVVNGVTYTRTASPLSANSMVNSYSSGTFIYPKYYIDGNNIRIYPTSVACTLATGEYFRTPYVIDVANNSTNIPYSDKCATDLIKMALDNYGEALRDTEFEMTDERLIARTSNVVTK